MTTHCFSTRRGITLIEILVTVSLIGILLALLLPAVQEARETSRRIRCVNNLKQIGMATQNFCQARESFPSGVSSFPAQASYLVQILPFLEQSPLFDAINMSDDVLSNANVTILHQAPSLFFCPSDASRDSTAASLAINYPGNAGRSVSDEAGVFTKRSLMPRDLTDGLSQTVGVSEWIAGSGTIGPPQQRNASKYRLKESFTDSPQGIENFVQVCSHLNESDTDPKFYSRSKGQFWIAGLLSSTLYNHTLTPRPTVLQSGSLYGCYNFE